MTIQSRWKDYYDYIGFLYGQDPETVYVRKPLTETIFLDCPTAKAFPAFQYIRGLDCYKFEYLVAGTYVFPIIHTARHSSWERDHKVTLEDFRKDFFETTCKWYRDYYQHVFEPNCGVSNETLADTIRTVGQPVFLVCPHPHDSENLYVDCKIPVLADQGIPALVPPEQMWQGIYGTLTNVLRKNPDKAPPVQLSNESRIQKAGFDLKTSFRGQGA